MYNPLSKSARHIIQLARQEGQRFEHPYVSTGHLLLGLLKDSNNLGYKILQEQGFNLRIGREELEKLDPTGPTMVTMGRVPGTRDAQNALDCAHISSLFYQVPEIQPEDLFSGLLTVPNSTCQNMLLSGGLNIPQLRSDLLQRRGGLDTQLNTTSVAYIQNHSFF